MMKTRTLTIIFDVGVFLLLALLVLQTADMRRSLRRIEHEERRLVTRTRHPFVYLLRGPVLNAIPGKCPSLNRDSGIGWDALGDWVIVPIGHTGPCSNCRYGPFGHRYMTKEDCEKGLAALKRWINYATPKLQLDLGLAAECIPLSSAGHARDSRRTHSGGTCWRANSIQSTVAPSKLHSSVESAREDVRLGTRLGIKPSVCR
jgi:hypothetical protein